MEPWELWQSKHWTLTLPVPALVFTMVPSRPLLLPEVSQPPPFKVALPWAENALAMFFCAALVVPTYLPQVVVPVWE